MTDPRHNDEVIIAELKALKELLTLKVTYTEKEIEALKEQFEKNFTAINTRLTVIELWQANSLGRIATIFSIIGIVAGGLVNWIFKQF